MTHHIRLTSRQCASRAQVSPDTWYRWMVDYPDCFGATPIHTRYTAAEVDEIVQRIAEKKRELFLTRVNATRERRAAKAKTKMRATAGLLGGHDAAA